MPDIFHLHHLIFGDDDAGAHHATADHLHHDSGQTFDQHHADLDQQAVLGSHTDVPWINFGPHAAQADSDHDGTPDALDQHVGPGAHDLPPGAFSSGVPWQQLTPDAMHHDTDGDGIPDALDNHVGPGA